MGRVAFTKASVVRAIEAAKEAGVEVGTVEILSDGTIRIIRTVAEVTATAPISQNLKRWAG